VNIDPAIPTTETGHRAGWVASHSLLWRVMILVVVGTAGVLVAFGIASLLAVNESRDHTLDERQALARATAHHVDYVVQRSLASLDELGAAGEFDLEDGDPLPEQQALRRTYLSSVFSRGLYVTDADGRLLMTESAGPARAGEFLGSMPAIAAALTSASPTVSGLVPGIGDGAPVLMMIVPARDADGLVQGAIIGEIDPSASSLSEIIASGVLGETGYTQIIDQQGTVLASTSPHELLQENPHQTLVADLTQQTDASSAGSCHACHQLEDATTSAPGDKEVMAFAPLEAAPWGVLIRQRESEALAPARRLEQRAIWLGVPAFIVAILFAWATVRSIVKPVRVLTATAQRLAGGDLSQPVPETGTDEIGQLGSAFEGMRVRLKQALERVEESARVLETRVQERTRELETSRDNLRTAAEEKAALYQEVIATNAARRELLGRVISAQEEERRRIARELHDETSQNLSVLAMGLETAGLGQDGEPQGREELNGLRDLAVTTLGGVRRLVYDLRPSVLDDLGLLAGLRWYAENRLNPLGIRFSLLVSGEERRLAAELETAIFRIGQEAISNIARHAGASNAFLGVGFQEDRVTLEVEDDGAGFDVSRAEVRSQDHGWGLFGIRERAGLFGGSLEITSAPGAGTRLEISIPLQKETQDDANAWHDTRTDS
jgi:signal transduction histidine kinase